MLIDCHTCVARDIACDDCVVTVLLARPPARRPADPRSAPADPVALDESEQVALGALAGAGLVPPLRLVRPFSPSGGLSDTA
ncbi:hypothetical protein [Jatrophihabitans endophyticus]|uniref:hypothetical protein n=1 Tax=Jatrophihabitans endophyticus TaxID=1206085 RepID=UPI0019E8C981|nr:hypothetical protein [Jatrophihabitans endophyticus]MBE7189323.1 hypothetical protein [Jatrophihabitans endophyticus]